MMLALLLLVVAAPCSGQVSTKMKAAVLSKPSTDYQVHLENIVFEDVPVPVIADDEVLIKVESSSVNPVDWKVTADPGWVFPLVLGFDCLGTVAQVGGNATRLKVGDAVWVDQGANMGSYAEYVAAKEAAVGLAPAVNLPSEVVGTLPLVGLTAREAFRWAGVPFTGKTVVVLGGSGGVGHVALQLAKIYGAGRLVTTCGTDVDFCRGFGADQVIDYHVAAWYDVLKPGTIDVIFDTVGISGTAEKAYEYLKDNGRFVTIAGSLASETTVAERPTVKQHFFLTDSSDYRNLDELKLYVEAGELAPHVVQVFSYDEVPAAFNMSMHGHVDGKIGVRVQKDTNLVV